MSSSFALLKISLSYSCRTRYADELSRDFWVSLAVSFFTVKSVSIFGLIFVVQGAIFKTLLVIYVNIGKGVVCVDMTLTNRMPNCEQIFDVKEMINSAVQCWLQQTVDAARMIAWLQDAGVTYMFEIILLKSAYRDKNNNEILSKWRRSSTSK